MVRETLSVFNNKLIILLPIAVILGMAISLSFGIFFLIAIFAGFLFYISCRHKKRVFYAFLLAISLRILFSFLHMFLGYGMGVGSDLIGDSVGYSGGGAYVAEVLTKEKFEKSFIADELANLIRFRKTYKGSLPEYNDWRVGGYTYYLGLIYAFFGFSPVAVKLINSLLFIIIAYIIYRYLLKYFGERTGFIFLLFSLFLPSLFIWSISGLKDQIICFLFIIGIFSFSYLVESGKLWGIILAEGILLNLPILVFIGSFPLLFKKNRVVFIKIIGCALLIFFAKIGLQSLRPLNSNIFFYALQLLSLLYLFLYLYRFRLFKMGIVLLMVFLIIFLPVKKIMINAYRRFTYQSITRAMASQYDAITRYQIYPERYNNDKAMKAIGITKFNAPSLPEFMVMTAKGFGYALFSPLVWLAKSKAELLACFEGHLMVISFLWVLNAIFLCCRKHKYFTLSLPIIVPFFILLVLLAFFEGNVGTLFRHRSMMLPFYCALFAIGLGYGAIKEQELLP